MLASALTILAVFLASVAAKGKYYIPEGSPDGTYVHEVDAVTSGVKLFYLGTVANKTRVEVPYPPMPDASSKRSARLDRRTGVSCDSGHRTCLLVLFQPLRVHERFILSPVQSLKALLTVFVCCPTESSQYQQADQQMIDWCGNGADFSGVTSQVYGNAVAYGCDYGNGQDCHASDVSGFYNNVDGTCGPQIAGWWTQSSWKAAYGRTTTGDGYC